MEGKIVKYFDNKGFGFIETETKSSFFFHRRSTSESHNIELYDVVMFNPQKTDKGDRAVNIKLIRKGSPTQIKYIDEYPEKVLYSRNSTFPGGFKVDKEVGIVRSKAKGFVNARNSILKEASKAGANAIIITNEWETRHSKTTIGGWLNIFFLLTRPSIGKVSYALSGGGTYKYKMAHFEGIAVVVSRKKKM